MLLDKAIPGLTVIAAFRRVPQHRVPGSPKMFALLSGCGVWDAQFVGSALSFSRSRTSLDGVGGSFSIHPLQFGRKVYPLNSANGNVIVVKLSEETSSDTVQLSQRNSCVGVFLGVIAP